MRYPIASGTFYPSDKKELLSLLELLFSQVKEDEEVKDKEIKGLIVPHAGYIFSGHVAASGYKNAIKGNKKIFILGNDHRNQGIVATSDEPWLTPLGKVEVDLDKVYSITEEYAVEVNNKVMEEEHSIEVQLPFLQFYLGNFSFVPIQLPYLKYKHILELVDVIKDENYFYIASSDFTHYGFAYNYLPKGSWENPLEFVKKTDMEMIDKILSLDAEGFYDLVFDKNYTVCGVIPITLLLLILKEFKCKHAKLVKYDTSYSISRDLKAIVGYAAIVFW